MWPLCIIFENLFSAFFFNFTLTKFVYFIFIFVRYVYSGQYHLATVHFGLPSLVMCVFSLGLAVGVVVAVGMLLVFQVWHVASFIWIHIDFCLNPFFFVLRLPGSFNSTKSNGHRRLDIGKGKISSRGIWRTFYISIWFGKMAKY